VRDAGPDRIVVFQTPALFPWMNVRDQHRLRSPPSAACLLAPVLEDAARYMHAMGLDDFAAHYP